MTAWTETRCGRSFEDREDALAHQDRCGDCQRLQSAALDMVARDIDQRTIDVLTRQIDRMGAEQRQLRTHIAEIQENSHYLASQMRIGHGRLAAVKDLIEQAERGEGIIVTPGFTTYYSVECGLLRIALGDPPYPPTCDCGHAPSLHGIEPGGCIECRCTSISGRDERTDDASLARVQRAREDQP